MSFETQSILHKQFKHRRR